MLQLSKLKDEPAITLAFAGAAYAARSSSAWLVGIGAVALWWLWDSEPAPVAAEPAGGPTINFLIPGMREVIPVASESLRRPDMVQAQQQAAAAVQAAAAGAPAAGGAEGRIGVSVNDGGLAGLSIGARRNPGLGST